MSKDDDVLNLDKESRFEGYPFTVVYTDSIKRRNLLNNERFQILVIGLFIAVPVMFFFVMTATNTQPIVSTIMFDEFVTWFSSIECRLMILALLVILGSRRRRT